MRTKLIPARPEDLKRGTIVYCLGLRDQRGQVDHLRRDGQASMSYDSGEGHDAIPVDQLWIEVRA
jgi:hypothetical protein